MNRYLLTLLFYLPVISYAINYEGDLTEKKVTFSYPNFNDNPLLSPEMKTQMYPHLLPLKHKIKPVLDEIFSSSRAIESEQSLIDAGFIILFAQQTSYIRVAKHPNVPGYLFKINLDNETRLKAGKPGWEWLTQRCEGAERIRNIIKRKNIKHFSVPDKWLYLLPLEPQTNGPIHQPVVLIVTDMQLVSRLETKEAWKTIPTREYLDELFYILSHGCGSRFLSGNIPYTVSGKFAFIDTEYPDRKITLKKVKPYLSEEMQVYWDELCSKKVK